MVKENFVVDISPQRLTTKLRGQLSRYNERNPDHRINALFVMTPDGLFEVPLT